MPEHTTAFKYFAFISYSRKDSKAAAWLQKRLEWFRFPVKLVPENRRPPNPRYVRPIYRDRTNLEVTGEHYLKNIRRALEESRHLVVLCSPHSAVSDPVNMEVAHFLETHGGDASLIAPVIVSGNVTGTGADAALCPALHALGDRLTNRNLPTMSPDAVTMEQDAWEDGFVGLVSYLLQLERAAVGDHIQRETKRQSVVLRRWLVAVGLLATAALGAGGVAMNQRSLALASEQKAFALLSETLVSSASGSLTQGLAGRARTQLDACPEDLRFAEWRRVSSMVPHPLARLRHKWWCQAVASDSECRHVITQGRDDGVLLWGRENPFDEPAVLSSDARPGFAVDSLGARVLTSSATPAVVLHDVATRRELRRYKVDQTVVALAISADGRIIAWAAESEVCLASADEGGGIVTHRPGFKVRELSFGGAGGPILVVNGEDAAELVTIEGGRIADAAQVRSRPLAGAAWMARDSNTLVVGAGSRFSVQDAVTGLELRPVNLESAIEVLSVSPKGDHALFSLGSGKIALVSLETGNVVFRHSTPGGRTNDAHAFSSAGDLFAYDKGGGEVEVIGLAGQRRLGRIWTHESQINDMAFSPDGSKLITGGDDGLALVWPVDGLRNDELVPIPGDTFDMQSGSLDISQDGGRVVLADYEHQTATIYDPGSRRFTTVPCAGVQAVQAADGDSGFWAACGPPGRGVFRFDRDGRNPVKVIDGTGFLCRSADGRIAACVSPGGHPAFFDSTTGLMLREYSEFSDAPPHGAVMSPDGEHLIVNLDYADIRVLRRSEKSVVKLSLPSTVQNPGMAFSLAVSQDSTMLAAGFAFGELWLFQLRDGAVKHKLKASDFHVTGVCFADDDKRLVSLGSRGDLQYWDTRTGRAVLAETATGVTDDTWVHFLRADGRRRMLLTTDSGSLRIIKQP